MLVSITLFISLCLIQIPGLIASNFEVVTINSPPFAFHDEGNPNSARGYLIDLIEKLRQRLHFDYGIHFVRDGKFGEKLSNGRWNGIIGEIINRDADMALAPLTITSEREEVVQFTTQFMTTGITMLIKKPEQGKQLPFSTVEQLGASNYKFGTIQSGSSYAFFDKSKHVLYREMGKIIKKQYTSLPTNTTEAANKVKQEDFVFLGESAMLKFLIGHDCDLMTVGSDVNTIGYGIAFAKGSPHADAFTRGLQELHESGELQQLKRKWWTRRCPKLALCICPNDVSSEEKSGEDEKAEPDKGELESFGITDVDGDQKDSDGGSDSEGTQAGAQKENPDAGCASLRSAVLFTLLNLVVLLIHQ